MTVPKHARQPGRVSVGFRLVEAEHERPVKPRQLAEIDQPPPAQFVDLVGQVGGGEFARAQAEERALRRVRAPGRSATRGRARAPRRRGATRRSERARAASRANCSVQARAAQFGFQVVMEMLEHACAASSTTGAPGRRARTRPADRSRSQAAAPAGSSWWTRPVSISPATRCARTPWAKASSCVGGSTPGGRVSVVVLAVGEGQFLHGAQQDGLPAQARALERRDVDERGAAFERGEQAADEVGFAVAGLGRDDELGGFGQAAQARRSRARRAVCRRRNWASRRPRAWSLRPPTDGGALARFAEHPVGEGVGGEFGAAGAGVSVDIIGAERKNREAWGKVNGGGEEGCGLWVPAVVVGCGLWAPACPQPTTARRAITQTAPADTSPRPFPPPPRAFPRSPATSRPGSTSRRPCATRRSAAAANPAPPPVRARAPARKSSRRGNRPTPAPAAGKPFQQIDRRRRCSGAGAARRARNGPANAKNTLSPWLNASSRRVRLQPRQRRVETPFLRAGKRAGESVLRHNAGAAPPAVAATPAAAPPPTRRCAAGVAATGLAGGTVFSPAPLCASGGGGNAFSARLVRTRCATRYRTMHDVNDEHQQLEHLIRSKMIGGNAAPLGDRAGRSSDCVARWSSR